MVLLTGLFVFRVFAQLVQATYPLALLPEFDRWHGSAMPYPALVGFQILVILGLVTVLRRMKSGSIVPTPWKHRACFAIGGVYFASMTFRLIAGLSFLSSHPWFAKSLPAAFHVVLASFILALGSYIYKKANKKYVVPL